MSRRRAAALVAASISLVAADAREVGSRPDANAQRPVWSPDGRSLSWEANHHDTRTIELYVGPIDTWAFNRVTPNSRGASSITAAFGAAASAGPQVVHELTWAPASVGRFAYTASSAAQDFDLYVSGGGALAPGPGADGGGAWSPDGRRIAFSSARTGQGDIYVLDLAGDPAPTRISSDPSSSELDPRWTPDSAGLVWVGHTPLGDNLWYAASLGAPPTQLVAWPGSQVRPSVSPDGAYVAFYADRDRESGWDLWVVPLAEPAAARRVSRDVQPNARGPSWTPDSRQLVVVRNDDDAYDPLIRVDVATGTAETLDFGTVSHGDLDVAAGPDGQTWVAFVAQGRVVDSKRGFRRVFVAPLSP